MLMASLPHGQVLDSESAGCGAETKSAASAVLMSAVEIVVKYHLL